MIIKILVVMTELAAAGVKYNYDVPLRFINLLPMIAEEDLIMYNSAD